MYYQEIPPGTALAPYIKCLWILEDKTSSKNRPLEKVLPDACPELIIHYGDLFRIKDPTGKIKKQGRSFVFGPLTRHIEIGPTGSTGMIAARFYPGALASFIRVPVKELSDRYVSLSQLFGKKGAELEKAVCAATSTVLRQSLIEAFLVSVVQQEKTTDPLLPQRTLEQIAGREEPVKIAELSKQLNVSSRHLERKFNAQFGMTPKLFLKILRFQNIFKIIQKGKVKSLTDLTYRAGYFDQSHFYRDFKQFAGHSPKEHFKENAKFTRLFTSGA
jgi:AraC-like DNA-binding protein